MPRASILAAVLLAATGAVSLADTALAQDAAPRAGQAAGLRYLSWQGRGEVAVPSPAAPVSPVARDARLDLRRPNRVIPHSGFAAAAPPAQPHGLTPAPGSGRTLTPANAWMRPAAMSVAAPVASAPASAPAPAPAATPPSPAPVPAPAPIPRALPDYLPEQGGRGQSAPADIVYAPAPSPVAAPVPPPVAAPVPPPAVDDPMAPRRDAPIFRMGQGAPPPLPAATPAPEAAAPDTPRAAPQPRPVAEVANTGERPPQQGARYYSVHRQNGRQPDSLEMPEATYVDALAITMTETPASQDLAQPDQGPTLIRDNQGRLRAAPAASDGDHQ